MPRTADAAIAAAELVRAARRFLETGAKPVLVRDAEAAGCRFAVMLMLPEGRARVDLVDAQGVRTTLLNVPAAR